MSEASEIASANQNVNRIDVCFQRLRQNKKPALISYIMTADPDAENSLELMKSLVSAGTDIIELGMPFSDPMADGPTIQRAAIRSLKNHTTISSTLEQLYKFRKTNATTPVILMGYYNPVLKYGLKEFCNDAEAAGADGFIIVDLPPEEDAELYKEATAKGLALIKLVAPTSDAARIKKITEKASGFVYFISMAGTTGTKTVNPSTVMPYITKLEKQTDLPIAVGFGIKTPDQAQEIGKFSDAVVVGSSIVEIIEKNAACAGGGVNHKLTADVFEFVDSLSKALKSVSKIY